MRIIVGLLLIFLFGSTAEAQGRPSHSLMAARLQSFEAVTRLLAEHNPDLRGLTRNEHSLPIPPVYQSLMRQAQPEVVGAVTEQVLLVEQQLQALELLTIEGEALVPARLNAILVAHHQIDHLLTDNDDMQSNVDTGYRIDQLNLAIARLGLLYQTRLFNGLMVHAANPEGDVLAELDGRIMELFEQLHRAGLGSQPLFQRSQRNYRFVRSALLDQQANWVPNAALLYLNDAMHSLVELRAEIGEV